MTKQISLDDFSSQLLSQTLSELQRHAQKQRLLRLDVRAGESRLVWRLDEACSYASGNKLFKQALYWKYAEENKSLPLLSFGGAYSNHLYALAAEAQRRSRELIAIVRGLHEGKLNPCLQDLQDMGAHIQFVSRKDYRQKADEGFLHSLVERHGPFIHVPEGGGGLIGAFGAQAIGLVAADLQPQTIVLAAGTGSTAAGVLAGLDLAAQRSLKAGRVPVKKRLLIVPVINLVSSDGEPSLLLDIKCLRTQLAIINEKIEGFKIQASSEAWVEWACVDGFQFGGYGKYPPNLAEWVQEFEKHHGVPLDPIYTAKAMAMADCYQSSKNSLDINCHVPLSGSNDGDVLFIHCGGLQGRRGFNLL